jgi:hypothetical protein
MMTQEEITLEIHYLDNKKITIRFTPNKDDEKAKSLTFLRDIKFDRIAVESNGDLIIIPMNQVRYIRATPAPKSLPKQIPCGATFIDA